VRGVGLVLAIEFAANKETCEAWPSKWGMFLDQHHLISVLWPSCMFQCWTGITFFDTTWA